ncbi:MAG: oligosaccharide flippase family protein [Clostridia bacterium]|nr:oligosaccharide flippase family protein [Clostridia bacterium]
MNELSYSKNTLFLIFAGGFSQIFGAVIRVFLSHRLKAEGMALYQVSLCIYSVFLTPVLFGMPVALTQFISKHRGSERNSDISGGTVFSFKIMCGLGILSGFLMFLSRRFLAISLKEPSAEYAILALSPSVFFVALGAFAKSCFEGHSNMLPCAVSQTAESILKLLFAYLFICIFGIFSLKYAVMGATLAITVGEAFATLILFLFMPPLLKNVKLFSKSKIHSEIIAYAIPVTAYAVILSSLNLLENSVIRNSLLAVRFNHSQAQRLLLSYPSFISSFESVKTCGKLSARGANALYGAYFGYALTVIRFPIGLLRTFCVPFFPLASRCFAEKNIKKLKSSVSRLIMTMLLISVPIAFLIIILSPQITKTIFGSAEYANMLIFVTPLLIILPLTDLFSTLWYASGKTFPPFIFSVIASILSVFLSALLIRIPCLNILGVAVSTVISSAFELFLFFCFTNRYIK